ncbi:MAG TPA: ABC transporter ATP-binding protein [Streptosporangiaceae bacterium]|jgi:ABC-type branched-subunit amino acid transport system ATPase component|nr:ABC transporter ATP-binding protein [Streptosporangiaceae bacterium]
MLSISGLYAGYGGGDVLRGVTMTVAEGSITCVVGPNGAGKSTLLKVISGLLRPRAGSVTFRGKEIGGASPRRILQAGVVQIMQSRNLFPELTVRENVELGGFLLRDPAEVRKRLAAIAEQFPVVAERARERAGQLSGGQQRMVEFARALMLDPALVVLDEPSMGLEPRAAGLMYDTIKRMHEAGRTVLLVEQNVRAGLSLASHGVVMEAGRVRLEGTGAEILANPQMRALYLGGTIEEGRDGEVPAAENATRRR